MKRHRIRLKRVYEPAAAADGNRILVERLWPRGLSKRRACIDSWAKSIAPSPELRKWFDHRPERWDEFKNRYFTELDSHPEAVAQLRTEIEGGIATFVFASREEQLNSAAALAEYLETR